MNALYSGLWRISTSSRFCLTRSLSTNVPLPRYPTVPQQRTKISLDAVLKVYTAASRPNFSMPWQNRPITESSGSAFCISERRIITNAHVVADGTFVAVRRHGDPTKYPARVVKVSHQSDLALLHVEDDLFWRDMTHFTLGGIPELRERVEVIGYPQGGDNISITQGCVSRIEPQEYAHSADHLLAIQIDASVNPGNSGGPCVNNRGEVVGVAFQSVPDAENMGYLIPTEPILSHFLRDSSGLGICALGVRCQALENPHLQKFYGMEKLQTGVLVNAVAPTACSRHLLQPNDVLLEIDGKRIANDGSIVFRGGMHRERISFDYLVSTKLAGESVSLVVLRDREVRKVEVPLGPLDHLVPPYSYDRNPSYLIHAGLVFFALVQPYLHEFGDNWQHAAPRKLVDRALYGIQHEAGEQVVILSSVLVDDINAGYAAYTDLEVKAFNGQKIKNLRHLKTLIDDCRTEYMRIDLDDERVVVLHREQASQAHKRILQKHRIPRPQSADLEPLE